MATTSDDLLVKIVVDASGAIKGFQTANGAFVKLAESSKKTEGALGESEKGFLKAALAATGLNEGLELTKKAYEAVVDPIKECINAFAKQEKAEQSLASALRITGQFSEGAMANFQEFAESLSRTTTASEDTTLQLASMAKQMGLSDDFTKKMIRTAIDLAAVTGEDVTSAFAKLQASLHGNARGLEEVAPELKKFSELQNQGGAAVDYLNKKLAGRGAADAKTMAGAMAQLGNEVEKLKATIGGDIEKIFGVGTGIKLITGIVHNAAEAFKYLGDAVTAVRGAIDAADIAGSLERIGAAITGALLVPVLTAMAPMIGTLAAMAAPLVAVAAEWIAIGGAIALAAVSLDIILRNLTRLPELGQAALAGFRLIMAEITKLVTQTNEKVLGGIRSAMQAISGTFADVGGFATKAADGLGKVLDGQAALGEAADKEIEAAKEALKKYGSQLDLGLVGQFMKALDALKKLRSESEKMKAPDSKGGPSGALSPQQMQAFYSQLNGLVLKNQQLRNSIVSIDKDTLGVLQDQDDLINLQTNIAEKELAARTDITDEMKEQLRIQLELANILQHKQVQQDREQPHKLVGDQDAKAMRDVFGKAFDGIVSGLNGVVGTMFTGIGAMMNMISTVLDVIQKIIDFIPTILQKIADIFNSLTDLPNKIANNFQKMMTGISNFVSNFIPNLLRMIPSVIRSFVNELADGLPAAFESLFKEFPKIFTSIIDQFPALIEKLISGVITNMGRLPAAVIEMVISLVPALWHEILRLIPALVMAIVNGIAKGLSGAWHSILDIGNSFQVNTDSIKKATADMTKTIHGVTNDVFKVIDFTAAAKGTSMADQIRDAIGSGTNRAQNAFQQAWAVLKGIWDRLMNWFTDKFGPVISGAWHVILDFFENKFGAVIGSAWHDVLDLFNNKIAPAIGAAWHDVLDLFQNKIGPAIAGAWQDVLGLFNSLGSLVQTAFGWVDQHIVQPLSGIGQSAFRWVEDKIVKPLSSLKFPDLSSFKWPAIPTFTWPGLPKWSWPEISEPAWLSKLTNIGGSGGSGGKGFVAQVSAAASQLNPLQRKAYGGPIYAAAGTFIPSGADQVPVMAQAGEFMQRKSAVDFYGRDFMEAVNQRKYQPAQAANVKQDYHITLNIQPSKVDDDYVKRELAPKLMKEIYRASTDGRAVINAKGIRS